jgi:Phage integrase, N-terminal SAM-like domain
MAGLRYFMPSRFRLEAIPQGNIVKVTLQELAYQPAGVRDDLSCITGVVMTHINQVYQGGQKPKLLDQVRYAIRTKHYSLRTEEAYIQWIRRFILFHNKRHPKEMGAEEVGQFLSDLAVKHHVAASTQNQALSAILFLYQEVLRQEDRVARRSCACEKAEEASRRLDAGRGQSGIE